MSGILLPYLLHHIYVQLYVCVYLLSPHNQYPSLLFLLSIIPLPIPLSLTQHFHSSFLVAVPCVHPLSLSSLYQTSILTPVSTPCPKSLFPFPMSQYFPLFPFPVIIPQSLFLFHLLTSCHLSLYLHPL